MTQILWREAQIETRTDGVLVTLEVRTDEMWPEDLDLFLRQVVNRDEEAPYSLVDAQLVEDADHLLLKAMEIELRIRVPFGTEEINPEPAQRSLRRHLNDAIDEARLAHARTRRLKDHLQHGI